MLVVKKTEHIYVHFFQGPTFSQPLRSATPPYPLRRNTPTPTKAYHTQDLTCSQVLRSNTPRCNTHPHCFISGRPLTDAPIVIFPLPPLCRTPGTPPILSHGRQVLPRCFGKKRLSMWHHQVSRSASDPAIYFPGSFTDDACCLYRVGC